MFSEPTLVQGFLCLALTSAVVESLRTVDTRSSLIALMEAISREMGFRYHALVHHDDLRVRRPDRVDLRDYPATGGCCR
jgi:hypothetical protein